MLQIGGAVSPSTANTEGFCQGPVVLAGDPGEWHLAHFPRGTSASDQAFTVISTWSLYFMLTALVTSSLGGKERLFLPSLSADWQVTPNVLGGFCVTTGMGLILPKYSTTCDF